jgi:hypothetical protein
VAKEKTSKTGLKEQRRQEIERQRRRQMLQIGIPIAIIIIALAVLLGMRLFAPPIEGVVELGPQESGHDDDIVIAASPLPPAGGMHHPSWQTCAIYEAPVDSKYAIHSMEHGAVWITYSPDLPAEDVATLRDVVGSQGYILMSPYPGLASPIVLTAWGLQLQLDSASDARIEQFIDRYRLGPQTPETGVSCSGGVNTTVLPQG